MELPAKQHYQFSLFGLLADFLGKWTGLAVLSSWQLQSVKIGIQILKDLGKIKKFFSVRLAAVYSTVNRRCRLFACFFVSDLLLFTACKHAALV